MYSVGASSGAIKTKALLGVYPDVFMAGVSVMGVPCGCWAELQRCGRKTVQRHWPMEWPLRRRHRHQDRATVGRPRSFPFSRLHRPSPASATFSVSGAGHTLSVDGPTVAAYFGLDKKGGKESGCSSALGSRGEGPRARTAALLLVALGLLLRRPKCRVANSSLLSIAKTPCVAKDVAVISLRMPRN